MAKNTSMTAQGGRDAVINDEDTVTGMLLAGVELGAAGQTTSSSRRRPRVRIEAGAVHQGRTLPLF